MTETRAPTTSVTPVSAIPGVRAVRPRPASAASCLLVSTGCAAPPATSFVFSIGSGMRRAYPLARSTIVGRRRVLRAARAGGPAAARRPGAPVAERRFRAAEGERAHHVDAGGTRDDHDPGCHGPIIGRAE